MTSTAFDSTGACPARTPIVIWGASGHALVVADIVRLEGHYEIVGYVDDMNPDRRGEEFGGARVLGGRECLAALRPTVPVALIAIGSCAARLALGDELRDAGFKLARAVHPRATVARDVSIGAGTVLCAGALLAPRVVVGESVLVNTAATVDHQCELEAGVHIGPGVHLGGNVRVGRGAWIGIGATVCDRVCIGAGAIVGAGAVVLHDVAENIVAYGVPAHPVRTRADRD